MFPGSGTQADPYRCSPTTDEYLSKAVEASWEGTNHTLMGDTNRSYWIDKANHPEEYSDGFWRQGWNRYWETRMRSDNTGSADPKLGDLPAQYQPSDTIPIPPIPPIDDINAKLNAILDNQGTILNNQEEIMVRQGNFFNQVMLRMQEFHAEEMFTIRNKEVVFPPYTGKLSSNMTFNPKQ